MATKPLPSPLTADLPENWTYGQRALAGVFYCAVRYREKEKSFLKGLLRGTYLSEKK